MTYREDDTASTAVTAAAVTPDDLIGPGDRTDRFFYGWYMVPMATLSMMCTAPAQTFGVSAFKPYFTDSLGLTPAQVSGAYMFGTFFASLPQSFIGAAMDRFGPRRTKSIVVLMLVTACFVASQAQGLITLFLAFLMLRMFGQGALGMLSGNTLALWFNRRLGTVSGLMAAGMAIAIAFGNGLFLKLIVTFGWRNAYMIIGVALAALLLPMLALIYRDKPEDVGQLTDGESMLDRIEEDDIEFDPADGSVPDLEPAFTLKQAWRTRAFWIVAACISIWSLAMTAFSFCVPSIFESRGLGTLEAGERSALMFFAMGMTLIPAQLVSGFMADRTPLNLMLTAGTCMLAVVAAVIRMPGSENLPVVLGIAMGASQAILVAVGSTIWVRYYGRKHLGKIRGSLVTIIVAASSVGPFLVDGAYALLGEYETVLTALIIAPLPLAVAGLFATKPKLAP